MASVQTRAVTIIAAATQSEAFESGTATDGSFSIPAAITGTTMQPQFSNDAVNWTNVGSAIAVAINTTYPLPGDLFRARFARLVSNSSEASERIITVGLKR